MPVELAALRDQMPEAWVGGVAAGLFALVELPPGVNEQALVTAAQARDLGVEGLASHRVGEAPAGLILGYGSLPEPAIARGVALLAEAM